MDKYYLDANVVIDFAWGDGEFFKAAEAIFKLADQGLTKIGFGIISVPIVDYVCKKKFSLKQRKEILDSLRQFVEIAPSSKEDMDWAIFSNFSDLEYAMQNHIAEFNGYSAIITRNKKDFKKSNLAILTPDEFLATL